LCTALLRPFVRHGEIAVHYRCQDRKYTAFIRVADLQSDWQTVQEVAVEQVYRMPPEFVPDLIIDGGGNTGLFTSSRSRST
jgi:hypothetical protein